MRELTCSRLRVVWTALDGTETVVAETEEGYRVLETTYVQLGVNYLTSKTSTDILPASRQCQDSIAEDIKVYLLRGKLQGRRR